MQNDLSYFGQTITFDHAGIGWSSETSAPRTIENLVKELSIIIETNSIEKVILICHSLGSLEAIGYAQANPDKVEGIIFLDGGSPEFYSTDSEFFSKSVNRILTITRFLGLNRLLGELGVLLPMYGENARYENLPDDLRIYDKAMYYRYSGSDSNYENIDYINENADAVLSGNRLGEIPILVLSSDDSTEWMQVQLQLSAWSENSSQVTIDSSGHYLHWTNYDETIENIYDFLQDCILD